MANYNSSNINNNNQGETTVKLRNVYLEKLQSDYLYHLGIGSNTHDLKKMFGDVKFVCMGGTPNRMKNFAEYVMNEIGYDLPVGNQLLDICEKGNRFAMYKVGPVISVSHGMGMPSLSILLHELIKLLNYANCIDPILIRIGTSGGIGVEPGTVIVTEKPLNGYLKNEHSFCILGKTVNRPAILDEQLRKDLLECAQSNDDFELISGNTMATDDFYEGQGRLDGAVCGHTEKDKFDFLKHAYAAGVRNIEMESTLFAALTYKTNVRAADVCVTFLDRFNGDQVTAPKETKTELEQRPQIIVARYIKKVLESKK